MKITHLPLLPFDASLLAAYQAMQWHLKSAVVRTDFAKYSLIRAPELYAGIADNFSVLGALRDKFPIHQISNRDIRQWGLDVTDPSQTGSEFERLLDQVNKKYAVLDSRFGIIRVVTRHEVLAEQLNFAPTVCYCDNDDYMHPYPPPDKAHGELCYCGYKISCR
jgi:hypothetical protein